MQPTGEAVSQPLPLLASQEITENGNRRAFNADITQEENNNMDHYTSYNGVQYSPLDMAEYIFWTGDEKGVTLAIEEFLQEGLMSREEAIAFLQEIKYNIEYLQSHYIQQRLKSAAEQRMQQENTQMREIQMQLEKNQHSYQQAESEKLIPALAPFTKFNHDKILKALTANTYERNNNLSPATLEQLSMAVPDLRQDIYKKSVQDNSLQSGYKYLPNNGFDQFEREPSSPNTSEEDYEDLLERLRVADFLYTEYSLEEIIYQLAKVMFTQTLSRGPIEAQVALQRFTNFMEDETEQGRISKGLEKKVLDVLIEALTDTLTERPDLITAAREGLGGPLPPNNKMLQQLLEHGTIPSKLGQQQNKNGEPLLKVNRQQWIKSQEHAQGENQPKIHPIQPVKRFRMGG